MTKKNNAKDMIISLQRICDVFLQYWWILLVSVAVMCVVVFAKGQATVEEEVQTQSVVLVSIQAEDLVDEKYLDNFLLDGRSEFVTSQSIANELVKLSQTERVQDEIRKAMEEKGYKECNVDDATIAVLESTRLISVSAKGNNIKKNIDLVNTIAEELVKVANEDLKLEGTRILSLAENEHDKADISKTYVTKTNMALLAMGIIIGIIIIGILVIMDKHIRSQEEIAWCYDGRYIGTIEKKDRKNSSLRAKMNALGILEKEGKKNVRILSLQKEEVEGVLKETFGSELEILKDALKLEKLKSLDGVILYINRKKDTFDQLDELISSLNNMNISVVGYIVK